MTWINLLVMIKAYRKEFLFIWQQISFRFDYDENQKLQTNDEKVQLKIMVKLAMSQISAMREVCDL